MSEYETNQFAKDVLAGLSSEPKYLLSKYFYDDRGSKIFQEIMQMPEYYLTDCELEIIKTHKQDILEAIFTHARAFDLIELGAGDGMKTKILLEYLYDKKADFQYVPIDISGTTVKNLEHEIKALFPGIGVVGQIGDYFHLLEEMSRQNGVPKMLMFLGSNIGNMDQEQSIEFLGKLRSVMNLNDLLLIGFDLKKDPEIIMKAYDDPHGLTAAFNLNLLQRINRELNADFDTDNFRHVETYDADSGTAKSYLISQQEQSVYVGSLNQTFGFRKGEVIYMEMSQKYDMEMIRGLAENSGFEIVRNFNDKRQFFTNSIWKPKT
ncbi:MAG: L-histidine N(alpha)-methyltransferase [Bacteroidales bacterium]|nr:L-histidine N(alpha)-methyltransferase [Bacteroidales bacterium]